jgi:hypothetical protein
MRNPRRLVKVTEPVDTIFVKSIVLNGPADRAGLCVGKYRVHIVYLVPGLLMIKIESSV